jgi:hypothetical protein
MPKFSKDHQPGRRKGGTPPPPDTSGGLDPKVIDQAIAEPKAKVKFYPISQRFLKNDGRAWGKGAVPDPTLPARDREEVAADLAAFDAAAAKREAKEAAEKQERDAERLRLTQEKNRADAIEAKRQVEARAAALAEQLKQAQRDQGTREQQTHERQAGLNREYAAKIDAAEEPVRQELATLEALAAKHGEFLDQYAPLTWKQVPAHWTRPLQQRLVVAGGNAKTVRQNLKNSIAQCRRALNTATIHVGRGVPKDSDGRTREDSVLKEFRYCRDHASNHERDILSLVAYLGEIYEDAKRLSPGVVRSEPPQPVDPAWQAQRELRIEQALTDGMGVVRDGAHEPETTNREQVRAHPGRIDPTRDLPQATPNR